MAVASKDQSRLVRAAARLLGVRRGASIEDIVQARRVQAKMWHPDINPESGSAERMGQINAATDLLCDYIRRGGVISGMPAPAGQPRRPATPAAARPRVFEVRFEPEVSVPISSPDRHARLEIDEIDALAGGMRMVRFVRREPGRCQACAGLGAAPSGPKRVCPDCDGRNWACTTCSGRGWLHLRPGSCRHCGGSGAALVERSVLLKLPAGIREVRRTMVPGWGDIDDEGKAANLWVDLVPTPTVVQSAPWRFDYFGHNWPPPEGRTEGEWLAISNSPLPDEEMRELGFWRDQKSSEWVRQAPSDGSQGIIELIRQRQFFVPQLSS
ncbi:MAG TPA: DnaJ domain-containing protein [Candidatus Solibacter sp.]|jgi:molecular chaperone DnaJ|nr:DnaJ domain-containing protein [Candidatus Solibacter sp.]